MLNMLSHRNIIQFFGVVSKEPNYCLVTGKFVLFTYTSDDFMHKLYWRKNILTKYVVL